MKNQPVKTLAYEKTKSGRIVTCTIEQFDDDSAYVAGEDIGATIFEFAPVPEPSTVLLLMAGAPGLLVGHLRRRRSA